MRSASQRSHFVTSTFPLLGGDAFGLVVVQCLWWCAPLSTDSSLPDERTEAQRTSQASCAARTARELHKRAERRRYDHTATGYPIASSEGSRCGRDARRNARHRAEGREVTERNLGFSLFVICGGVPPPNEVRWRGDGVADGTRTRDNRNHNPGLYQLSYSHHWKACEARVKVGAPGGTRTHNPRLRRPVLYPVELRALKSRLQNPLRRRCAHLQKAANHISGTINGQ